MVLTIAPFGGLSFWEAQMPLSPVDTTTPRPNGKFGDPIKTGFEKLNDSDEYLEALANSKAPGDDLLIALAGLTTAVDKGLYFTGAKVPATYDLSPQGRTLLAAKTTAAQRTALGLTPVGSQLVTQTTVDAQQAALGLTPVGVQLVSQTAVSDQRDFLGLGSAAVAALLGTVSQSGGVPTGAVMEVGSNVNGKYWRFANGLQMSFGLLGPISLNSGAVYNSPSVSFPVSFVGAPVVLVGSNSSFNYFVDVGVESGITAANFRYAVRNGYTGAIGGIYIMVVAVGSWY
jgi:hypothetical protein